ncbi:MAG: thiolase domain-containing protein [Chloroflexi bacterium]|nr:thiolase domain-containing protein [Chloroflexota bacterium]
MEDVAIIGIGQTKIGEQWERSLRNLAVDAIQAALKDAAVDHAEALYVGNTLAGEFTAQQHLGALLADWASLGSIEALRVEAASASGAAAIHMGHMAVASGQLSLVVVCGVEKMTDTDPAIERGALASAMDAEYEAMQGLSLTASSALLMRRYMYEYKVCHEDFAPFAINAHKNALGNPYAQFHKAITLEDFKRAPVVADPITMLDSAPVADGAAALVLCSGELARRSCSKAVYIRASVVATDRLALHSRRDPLFLQAAYVSAHKAYLQAGIGPSDIDLFELHDASTLLAALSLEACGFAPRGKGIRLGQEGQIDLQGSIPISTMGGLKARGDPLGATGVYQVAELIQHLRGEAGANQVRNARIGMAQNIGGNGATAITHILEAPY